MSGICFCFFSISLSVCWTRVGWCGTRFAGRGCGKGRRRCVDCASILGDAPKIARPASRNPKISSATILRPVRQILATGALLVVRTSAGVGRFSARCQGILERMLPSVAGAAKSTTEAVATVACLLADDCRRVNGSPIGRNRSTLAPAGPDSSWCLVFVCCFFIFVVVVVVVVVVGVDFLFHPPIQVGLRPVQDRGVALSANHVADGTEKLWKTQ